MSRDDNKRSTNDNKLERTVYSHKHMAYSKVETKFENGVENSLEVCIGSAKVYIFVLKKYTTHFTDDTCTYVDGFKMRNFKTIVSFLIAY